MNLRWGTFCLYLLALYITGITAVEIKVKKTKPVGSSGTEFKLFGQCKYKVKEPAVNVEFNIELDKPTKKLKGNKFRILSTDGNDYRVTNKKPITSKKYKVTFKLEYSGEEVPTGNCTELEVITTTSSTTSTTSMTTTTPELPDRPMEMLQNNDMEYNFTDNWFCGGGCSLEASTDSYTGTYAAKIYNRDTPWKGLSQMVNLTAGVRYSLSGYIKLLNVEPGALYHAVDLIVKCTDTQGKDKYLKFGSDKMVQAQIWTKIGAIVTVPSGYTTYKAYFAVYGTTVEYLADHMSLFEVPDLIDWKSKAIQNIEKIRKADITLRLTGADPFPENITVELKQTKHGFPFGSCFGASEIVSTDPFYQKYQEFFYEYFNWGTISNALKWKGMEKVQGVIDYERPTAAINAMRARGIKLRGHNMFWGVDKHVPGWVKTLSPEELIEAMEVRINGTVMNTTGLLEHWDVNNENLHGDFYERQTGDANITMKMFRDMYALDQTTELFLNDYNVIKYSGNQLATFWQKTENGLMFCQEVDAPSNKGPNRKLVNCLKAMVTQAERFLAEGVPLHGIGLQSHLKPYHVDITAIKARLDQVAEVGLPIWITELSVEEKDENKKAEALDDLLHLYFSHPAVKGIILWGFWDGKIWKPDQSLFEGPDMTPNAAGDVFLRLFKKVWRKEVTLNVTDDSPVSIRGFKGDYTLNVKQNDVTLKTEMFTLGSSGVDVTIDLSVGSGM